LLDPKWTAANVAAIFRSDPSLDHLRQAAWTTYLIFCRAYDNVLELLWDEYGRAVDAVRDQTRGAGHIDNPDKHLAQHLMVFYWRGRMGIDTSDGLVARFFERAPSLLRESALSFIGRSLSGTPDALPQAISQRLIELWTWRYESIRRDSASSSSEMAAFGWWFASGKLGDAWCLARLTEVLAVTSEIEADHQVVERLATLVHTYPGECIECLRLLTARGPSWRAFPWEQSIRSTISVALQSGDDTVTRAAEQLIHLLGARGMLGYRDLLPKSR